MSFKSFGMMSLASMLMALYIVDFSIAQSRRDGPAFTVSDNAGMFGDAAKAKANSDIAQMRQRTGKDLLIETFKSAPDTKVDLKDKDARKRFFQKWAIDRAKNSKVNGVYVLVCLNPKYIIPVSGQKTRSSGMFTDAHLAELRNKIRAELNAKPVKGKSRADAALTAAVSFVALTIPAKSTQQTRKTAVPVQRRRSYSVWNWVLMIIVIGLVIWLIVGLFRMAQHGWGYYGYGGYAPMGFFPCFFGGFFGVMAGMWLYSSMMGGVVPEAYADSYYDHGGMDHGGDTDVGGDYHADDGGDWGDGGGDMGGGGDFGGGDFGGGDFGGGDFGGGW